MEESFTKPIIQRQEELLPITGGAYSNNPVMANYQEYGFVGMVSKPFHLDEMIKVLETTLKS